MTQAAAPSRGASADRSTQGRASSGSSSGERARPARAPLAVRVLSALASLKLTVTLFAMSIFLVFAGTLAQVEGGIWTVMEQYFRTPIAWIELQALAPGNLQWAGSFPFPGGWLLGAAVLVNLLAAHLMRFKLSWKRSGILMIHTGLIVLVLSEFVTGALAEEGQMTIMEGAVGSYVEDIRETELAVIDRSGGRLDTVVAIPESKFDHTRPGRAARIPAAAAAEKGVEIPFDLRVVRFMVNSRLVSADGAGSEGLANPADRGDGRVIVARRLPEVAGTSPSQRANESAAYVQLLDRATGDDLGTYLLSLRFARAGRPQVVEHDGKTYHLYLRFQRTYKPYALRLIDFKHEKYIGTEKPKNFASEMELIDPARGERREVEVRMNEPLRYRGDSIYQQAFLQNDRGTVLQVVTNPGWTMPYVSCGLITLGLLVHFVMSLSRFLGKQRPPGSRSGGRKAASAPPVPSAQPAASADSAPAPQVRPAPPPSALKAGNANLVGWAVVGIALTLGVGYIASGLRAPADDSAFALQRFAKTPVVHGGRVKPLGSLAGTSLLIVSDKRSFTDQRGAEHGAMVWLLDTMSRFHDNFRSLEHPVFRIDNHEVLAALGLEPRPGDYRYSLASFRDELPAIREDVQAAFEIDANQRSMYQKQLLELNSHVGLYLTLAGWEQPHALPPTDGSGDPKGWRPLREAIHADGAHLSPETRDPASMAFGKVLNAWAADDPQRFNEAVDAYHAKLGQWVPKAVRDAALEHRFDHANLFIKSMALYLGGFLLVCVGWLGGWGPLLKGGRWLVLFTLIVHTAAIAVRIYLMGRPPVTNLYSSAIFVGWAAVGLGLFLEWIYRNGVGTATAAGVGFASLIVAVNLELAADGETMEMMQAVLDTNFWLATHVVTITIGYAATFLAGALAIGFVLAGLFTRGLSKENARTLSRMIYGVICFGVLFSFVGTVLGGIWADQSWGRFWGWDPKENGALIIVLWNALILHARLGGIVKQRGLALLAVFGNVVTAWSWFGVNMLGVGLHSYGFMSGAAFWMTAFVLSQLAIIAVGLIPIRHWQSPAFRSIKPA